MTLGTRIRSLRKSMGLTQQNLADGVGVSRIYIQALESGRRTPSMKLLSKLADNLKATMSDLMLDYSTAAPRMQLEELLAGGEVDIWFRKRKLTDGELRRVERVVNAVLEAWDEDEADEQLEAEGER